MKVISFHSNAAKAAFIRDAITGAAEIAQESAAAIALDPQRNTTRAIVEFARNSAHVYQIRDAG